MHSQVTRPGNFCLIIDSLKKANTCDIQDATLPSHKFETRVEIPTLKTCAQPCRLCFVVKLKTIGSSRASASFVRLDFPSLTKAGNTVIQPFYEPFLSLPTDVDW